MMRLLLRSARRRLLHTFISKETIKPSSPTPSHLKTYNLSLLDQVNSSVYIPVVFFFPNYPPTSHHQTKAAQLKNSLSQTLTQYYPFSGRLDGSAFVDCSDAGVDFLEVWSDASLTKLMHLLESQYQPIDEFFASGTEASSRALPPEGWGSLVMVQLTYFPCGGIALAVSISHKIGDASTLLSFINHWASVNRSQNSSDKVFIPAHKAISTSFCEYVIDKGENVVTKKFVFPNSKLAELKDKVKDLNLNPTRIEVLNSLLFGCAVNATKANLSRCSSVKGYILTQAMNMRKRMLPPLPENYVGNMCLGIAIPTTMDDIDLGLTSLIVGIQNAKMKLTGVTDSITNQLVMQSVEFNGNLTSEYEVYGCSSLCRFPTYEVDFGWGKPIRVTQPGCPTKNFFLLMDTPRGDGVEALVALEEEDMAIFQNDEKLLAFAL